MSEGSTRTCPVCRTGPVAGFAAIEQIPVLCNIPWPTRKAALAVPRGDLVLGFCQTCGHIHNQAFDPELLEYSEAYENPLDYSPTFQAYAERLARDLVDRYRLHRKQVAEIACGKGEFLRLLCRLGDNRGLGFDPSYEPDRQDEATGEQVRFVRDRFGVADGGLQADLVCCRHALEHFADPLAFLSQLRSSLAPDSLPAIFFEVPNGLYSFRDLGIWDLIYEHCSYFCPRSLAWAFQAAGFAVQSVTEAYGGQFLCLEAAPATGGTTGSDPDPFPEDLATLARCIAAFAPQHRDRLAMWRRRLSDWARGGRKVAIWGGGSKGITFLNMLEAGDVVEFVVDINPHKQDRFAAGGGQRFVAPDFLVQYRPDAIIIMNPRYQREIARQLRSLRVDAELIAA